jgi:hypothetical protein
VVVVSYGRDVSDELAADPRRRADDPTVRYEIVGGPQAFGAEYTGVTLAIGADNYEVSASPCDPIGALAQAGPLRRLDVGDRPGWILVLDDVLSELDAASTSRTTSRCTRFR